jgi:hypothetical protein
MPVDSNHLSKGGVSGSVKMMHLLQLNVQTIARLHCLQAQRDVRWRGLSMLELLDEEVLETNRQSDG